MSQEGLIATSTSGNTPVTTTGVSVDTTVAGATIVFVPTGDFFITAIFVRRTAVGGSGPGCDFNLGWTAPDYKDVIEGESITPTVEAVGGTEGIFITNFETARIIPSGSIVRFNVVTPSTFSPDTEVVYLQGFYI